MIKKTAMVKYLLFALLFLAVLLYGVHIRAFKDEEEGSCISGLYLPLVGKYIAAEIPYWGEVIEIEMKETASSCLTELECGAYSSQVKYDIASKEFEIKEFESNETGARKQISNYCMPRSDANSDYYSPFFRKEMEGVAAHGVVRLYTEFGVYQIS